jgi:hypothetical protein
MKINTIEHPKMMHLMALLDVKRYEAVGIMETLWHFTARYARDGNLAKFGPKMIAAAIGWTEDADVLLAKIAEAGWLDKSQDGKVLYVHDWHEHCDRFVDRALADSGQIYANGETPRNEPRGQCAVNDRPREPKRGGMGSQSPLPMPMPMPISLAQESARKGEEKRTDETDGSPFAKATGDKTDDFETFWRVYPRKVGKKAAVKAWRAAKDRPGIDQVCKAVRAQAVSRQWQEGFVPHPATWLNQGRWADEAFEKKTGRAAEGPIEPERPVFEG